MTDILDLLGGSDPAPRRTEAAAKLTQLVTSKRNVTGRTYDEPEKVDATPLPHESEFLRPVGVTFLAKILGRQPYQITKRLKNCPVMGWHKPGGKVQGEVPLYDFLTAMAYLIPPKGNIEEWFGQQNAASLPPYVNKMWWDSAQQRNRVMRSSNQLWHDDEVMVVFGRVAMLIRQDVKMWVEDLPEKDLLSDKQYNALVDATNRLVEQVRKTLVENPRETATLSMAATIKDELESAGGMPDAGSDSE